MRKIFIIPVICVILLMITVSKINLQTKDAPSSNPTWKDYPLTVVDSKANKIKALTPMLIQNNTHTPADFATYAKGKVDDVEITLIDANNNGVYDEKGKDAIVIGNSIYALPVSPIICIKNKLYECKIEATAEKISLAPYEGKCGEVDMLSNFKCPLKLEMLILNCGDIYLDVSKSKINTLPCGAYTLWLGYLTDKKGSATIKQNEMKSIDVTDELDKDNKKKVNLVQWGAPYRVDCSCTLQDNKITIPESLNVYGAAGEEYYNVTPSMLPAGVEIFDSTKKSVAKGLINRSAAATTENPYNTVNGGFSGTIKKGSTPPYTIKLSVKNSIFGELKSEKEVK
ncbi:MAG: hypothetical protein V1709_06340 [Planctomycetota bacterium]